MLEKAGRDREIFPLSFGQKALYFLNVNSPESHAYNVAFTVRIVSELNTDALKKAFQILINRHSSLRTNYKIIDGKPVQEVHGYKEIFFEIIDASGYNETQLIEKVTQTNQIPFDLEKDSLFKVYLFKISDENFVLLISMHHIVSDGWSLGILFDEIIKLYESTGGQNTLPALQTKYPDYIKALDEFTKTEIGLKQREYWEKELSGELPNLNLPTDKPRPAIQSFNGATEYFTLEKYLTEGLKEISKSEGTTFFVTLLSVYQIFLSKYTGQSDIITGLPTAGRNMTQFENLIGYFINPVALRSNVTGETSFKEFLNQTKKKVLGAISNQDFPFALIVERLLHKRDPSRSPVFQTFFGLQKVQHNNEMQEMIIPGNKGVRVNWGKLLLESFTISQQEGQFDLTAEFAEGKNLFSGAFKYNTDLFHAASVKQMVRHFKNLIEEIVNNPGRNISEFQLLSKDESDLILYKWNETDFKYDNFDCIHKLFENQSNKTPDSVAVIFENESLTYKELNKRSNKLANYLHKLGVKPGSLTGICMERSAEMVISILGVLKAGGAYVPIDPSYPKNRIEFMINDSDAKILITQKTLLDILPENLSGLVLIDEHADNINKESDADCESKVTLKDLAYVIYTSGSTGTPKGVMIRHDSLANHMLWMKSVFGFDSSDNVLQKTPFSFDASVWEFYLPLITGGKLVMAKPEGHMDTAYLRDSIIKNNITIIQLVPSLLRMLLNEPGIEDCINLKSVFCGGEALTFELREKLFEKLNVNFYNLYGPTEATIDSVYYKCERDSENKIIPIGKPVYNTQSYVLDKYLNPVPVGVAGELILGGIDIAEGYLNNPELTKEKFIDDIFLNKEGSKLYKTGDLAKFLPDGNIEFLGRVDQQVKLRGFRIEPGEIESKLLQHKNVSEATIIVREDKPGNQRLAAYIVTKDADAISSNEYKNYLRASLPEYMIPAVFVELEKLPLTPNGKVDKKSLPVPEFSKADDNTFVAPKLPAEEILAGIWSEVLGLDKVGVNDNFFELGGDSIISIQIISKANQMGIKLTPRQIFRYQTVAELSGVINYVKATDDEQKVITGEVKLTPVQKWFFEQNLTEPNHYNHSVLLKVPKDINEKYLGEIISELIKHHDALRLKFIKEGTNWKQINDGINNKQVFSVEDFSEIPSDKINFEIEKNISLLQTSFKQEEGTLIRVSLYKTNPENENRLLIIIHHLCVDGISWRVILEDIYNAYRQLSNGEKIKFQPKTTSFKEWSNLLTEYADSEKLISEKEYWLSIFETAIKPIPADNLSGKNENTVASLDTISSELDEQYTQSLLKDVSKAYNTKINDILLTALSLAYENWSKENKLLINLEGHGREDLFETADLSRTVGWFTSIFPVVLKLTDKENTGSTIKSIKENLRQIPDNGIGFGVLKYLNKDKGTHDEFNSLPKPEILFNYLGQMNENIGSEPDWRIGKRTIVLDQSKKDFRHHVLEINIIIVNNKLKTDFSFSKNIHNRETIVSFSKMFEDELKRIIDHCLISEETGYTPSDFSEAGIDQSDLDNILANLK